MTTDKHSAVRHAALAASLAAGSAHAQLMLARLNKASADSIAILEANYEVAVAIERDTLERLHAAIMAD